MSWCELWGEVWWKGLKGRKPLIKILRIAFNINQWSDGSDWSIRILTVPSSMAMVDGLSLTQCQPSVVDVDPCYFLSTPGLASTLSRWTQLGLFTGTAADSFVPSCWPDRSSVMPRSQMAAPPGTAHNLKPKISSVFIIIIATNLGDLRWGVVWPVFMGLSQKYL